MFRLKQRDKRRTKEYSVTYQDVKSKEDENVTRKPIEMLAVTQQKTAGARTRHCCPSTSLHGRLGEKER